MILLILFACWVAVVGSLLASRKTILQLLGIGVLISTWYGCRAVWIDFRESVPRCSASRRKLLTEQIPRESSYYHNHHTNESED